MRTISEKKALKYIDIGMYTLGLVGTGIMGLFGRWDLFIAALVGAAVAAVIIGTSKNA